LILLGERHLAAALLLPLYYLTDGTVTLLRRLLRGERITQPHRNHFYQQAVDGGMRVGTVVLRILALNLALSVLAWTTLGIAASLQLLCLVVGAGLVGLLLYNFSFAKT
jgi:UDP-N-acetylmuramyl pentapeptide phosphotransferase/UDP-N-acetylglucosamine-1-phosphate transferase